MDTKQTSEHIAKAIGYVENGGAPNVEKPSKGKTGEMASIYQFTPDTWKNYSSEVFGKEVPLNADSETQVVLNKVNKWLEKGYKPEQIFSMWNAGTGEPDAYSGKFSNGEPSHGVNAKYGVKFDVPSYVKKGMKYFDEFSGGKGAETQVAQTPQQTPKQETQTGDPAQKLLSIINESQGNPVAQNTTQNSGLLGQTSKPMI